MTAQGRPLRVLQVSYSDEAGGAERSAKNLFEAYRELGHESWLAVGHKSEVHPNVIEFWNDRYRNAWVTCLNNFLLRYDASLARVRGAGRVTRLIRDLGQPMRSIRKQLGIDDFDYPATTRLLELSPAVPDILHCHNLHGGYFDLRCLPELARRVPTILNVRDAWLLSGHCAFSFDCERWSYGCGRCPDLSIFPAVNRDNTAYNWKRKRDLLKLCRVFVTTPSHWLLERVQRSIVAPAIIESRVIPNGVNTRVFFPANKSSARAALGIPDDLLIVLIVANGIRNNVWKDYKTLKMSIGILGDQWRGKNILVLAVGETATTEKIGDIAVRFVPFQKNSTMMAQCYRAADVYIHAAKVESFGNVLLEARACGTPIVATAVGGIPEQVKALRCDCAPPGIPLFELEQATGILTPPGDGAAMAEGIYLMLDNSQIRDALRGNGVRDVAENFSVALQADRFINWYCKILSRETY